jgi:hypothetical protein
MGHKVCDKCKRPYLYAANDAQSSRCPYCSQGGSRQPNGDYEIATSTVFAPPANVSEPIRQTFVFEKASLPREYVPTGSWFSIFFNSTAGCLTALILVPAIGGLVFVLVRFAELQIKDSVIVAAQQESERSEEEQRSAYALIARGILRENAGLRVQYVATDPPLELSTSSRKGCDTEISGRVFYEEAFVDFRVGIRETWYRSEKGKTRNVEPIFAEIDGVAVWDKTTDTEEQPKGHQRKAATR